jgi:hypothetical protein
MTATYTIPSEYTTPSASTVPSAYDAPVPGHDGLGEFGHLVEFARDCIAYLRSEGLDDDDVISALVHEAGVALPLALELVRQPASVR